MSALRRYSDKPALTSLVLEFSCLIPIRLDIQQRKRAEHAWQVGRRRRVQIGFIEFGETCDTEQAKAADHFIFQQLQHPQDSVFAFGGECPALQAADADE